MYLQNKYTNYYYNIVTQARSRNLPINVYTERHHIIPKSIGGTNCKNNIVKLTAREHFVCHWLLIKMVPDQFYSKMVYALNGMKRNNKNQKRYETKITSRVYEKVRVLFLQIQLNRTMSIETKNKISASKKGHGHQHTKETREKIAKAHLGKKKSPLSAEHKEKIRLALKGIKRKPHSVETKRQMSIDRKGKLRGPASSEHRKKVSDSKKGKKIHIDPITGKRYFV